MAKIVCFGEIMGRLNPPGHLRLEQADALEISYAGGEANVAVALAGYGHEAAFVSKLPDNPLGQSAVNSLRRYGVLTHGVLRGGSRLGLYFVEKGASQRPSKVVYDRTNSAIATADPAEFAWEQILTGADWFHFTGITPALSAACAEMCLAACRAAKQMGVVVSCDINYRSSLWPAREAGRVMAGLMPYVDVCIGNEEDAFNVFGIQAPGSDVGAGRLEADGYAFVAKELCSRFGFGKVAITLRGSLSASDNLWAGMLYTGGKACFSENYRIHIVDRVGGGDAFAGGLIHGLLRGWAPGETIAFAAAAACLKHTIEHDFNLCSEQEVRALMDGGGSGRVQR